MHDLVGLVHDLLHLLHRKLQLLGILHDLADWNCRASNMCVHLSTTFLVFTNAHPSISFFEW